MICQQKLTNDLNSLLKGSNFKLKYLNEVNIVCSLNEYLMETSYIEVNPIIQYNEVQSGKQPFENNRKSKLNIWNLDFSFILTFLS